MSLSVPALPFEIFALSMIPSAVAILAARLTRARLTHHTRRRIAGVATALILALAFGAIAAFWPHFDPSSNLFYLRVACLAVVFAAMGAGTGMAVDALPAPPPARYALIVVLWFALIYCAAISILSHASL